MFFVLRRWSLFETRSSAHLFTHSVVRSLTSGVFPPLCLRQRPSAAIGRRRGRLWGPCGSVSRRKVGLRLRRPMGRQGCWGGVPAAGLRVWGVLSLCVCVCCVCIFQTYNSKCEVYTHTVDTTSQCFRYLAKTASYNTILCPTVCEFISYWNGKWLVTATLRTTASFIFVFKRSKSDFVAEMTAVSNAKLKSVLENNTQVKEDWKLLCSVNLKYMGYHGDHQFCF